jgi:Universal stress protein family.
MFSKILVAYDGSPTSRSALAQAYELAQAEDADVTVVTSHRRSPRWPRLRPSASKDSVPSSTDGRGRSWMKQQPRRQTG